jgi:LPS-assembly lipoprotein
VKNKFIKQKMIRQICAFTAATLLAILLNGCGFNLRGSYLLAPELQTINLSSVDKFGELTRVIKQHLTINDVELVEKTNNSIPQMRILKDSLDRRTLSVFPNGQVAEYELIYTVRYQILIPDKAVQRFSFELNRDYQDDPDIALAKSRELSLMLSEMRIEAANKILRDMASIQL